MTTSPSHSSSQTISPTLVDTSKVNLIFSNSNGNVNTTTPSIKFVKDRLYTNGSLHQNGFVGDDVENKNNDPSVKIKTKFIDEIPLVTIRCKYLIIFYLTNLNICLICSLSLLNKNKLKLL
jgi:hypothetical protein